MCRAHTQWPGVQCNALFQKKLYPNQTVHRFDFWSLWRRKILKVLGERRDICLLLLLFCLFRLIVIVFSYCSSRTLLLNYLSRSKL